MREIENSDKVARIQVGARYISFRQVLLETDVVSEWGLLILLLYKDDRSPLLMMQSLAT